MAEGLGLPFIYKLHIQASYTSWKDTGRLTYLQELACLQLDLWVLMVKGWYYILCNVRQGGAMSDDVVQSVRTVCATDHILLLQFVQKDWNICPTMSRYPVKLLLSTRIEGCPPDFQTIVLLYQDRVLMGLAFASAWKNMHTFTLHHISDVPLTLRMQDRLCCHIFRLASGSSPPLRTKIAPQALG
jgi:hypothetical protein